MAIEKRKLLFQCCASDAAEIGTCAQRPTLENAQLCQGYECTISVLSTPIDAALLQKLQEVGVRFCHTYLSAMIILTLLYARKSVFILEMQPMRGE